MRVSMSATGSVNLIVLLLLRRALAPVQLQRTRRGLSHAGPLARVFYQDDFETPGISPRNAKPRKHKRQIPNLRRYARGRPHSLQRLCRRVENFGRTLLSLARASSNFFWIFASLTRFAVVATNSAPDCASQHLCHPLAALAMLTPGRAF